MIKEMYNKSSYKVSTAKHNYIVTLTRLKNTPAGCPRFEATLIVQNDLLSTYTYRFSGHYLGEQGEADYITKMHEEKHNI